MATILRGEKVWMDIVKKKDAKKTHKVCDMRRPSVVLVADTCTGMVKGTCPWTPAGIPATSKRKRQLLEENGITGE